MAQPQNLSGDARSLAHAVLRDVIVQQKPLDEALDRTGLDALPARDRAFARLLVMTVLRHRGEIEALLAQCLARPLPAKAAATKLVLWMGIAQLLYLGTPAHAAVHASVDLAAQHDRGGFKGLVNAVLKRVAAEGKNLRAALDADRLSVPAWLWERLVSAYGEALTRAIVEAHWQTPPLDLTVKEGCSRWAQHFGGKPMPNGSVRLEAGGKIDALEGYASGEWWVQDAAATLPARLLGDVAGKKIADFCAAPGGKTAQLALAGANVTAVDLSEIRLKRLRQNLARLKLPVETLTADARRLPDALRFDSILLDAPCSATGTLRRNPDVAWRRTPEDVAEMVALQQALLDRAVHHLLPGGTLVYCVCSLLPEEGERQMDAFFARHPAMRPMPIHPAELPGMEMAATEQGALRTLPSMLASDGGMDGFFAFRAARQS